MASKKSKSKNAIQARRKTASESYSDSNMDMHFIAKDLKNSDTIPEPFFNDEENWPRVVGQNSLGLRRYPHYLQPVIGHVPGKEYFEGTLARAVKLTIEQDPKEKDPFDGLRLEDLSESERQKLSTIKRLLEDENFKPDRRNYRKLTCWSEPSDILAGMPFHFRAEALDRYEEGIRVFGKVPVNKTTDVSKVVSVEVISPARPMGCPEPPPPGAEFLLAWREGNLWNWNLGEHLPGIQKIGMGRFRPGFDIECTKYFELLLRMTKDSGTLNQAYAFRTLDLLESSDEHLRNPDAATGFYAGVLFSRLFLYAEADGYYADKAAVKKSEWPEIIVHALDRHGWDTSDQQLLTLFGYRLDQSRNALAQNERNREVMFPDWPYTPVPRDKSSLTLQTFGKKFSDVKKRRKPEEHRDQSQMSRLRALLNE